MQASKTKQRINSSINCSSEQRSLERVGHAWDRGNMAQSISRLREGLPQGWGTGAPQQGCWRAGDSQTPAPRSRLPAPWPTDGCRGPARERKAIKIRWKRANLSATTESPKFQQPSWKNFIAFFTPEVSALYQTSQLQPQSFSDRTDSAAHWSMISFRQQPIKHPCQLTQIIIVQ